MISLTEKEAQVRDLAREWLHPFPETPQSIADRPQFTKPPAPASFTLPPAPLFESCPHSIPVSSHAPGPAHSCWLGLQGQGNLCLSQVGGARERKERQSRKAPTLKSSATKFRGRLEQGKEHSSGTSARHHPSGKLCARACSLRELTGMTLGCGIEGRGKKKVPFGIKVSRGYTH